MLGPGNIKIISNEILHLLYLIYSQYHISPYTDHCTLLFYFRGDFAAKMFRLM